MRQENAINKFSRLEIATLQLDRALELFLQDQDYISAITLGAASEEILGQMLRVKGSESSYDALKNAYIEYGKLRHGFELEGFNDLVNGIKNGLKHYQDGSPIVFDSEDYARDILIRATDNYWYLNSDETQNMIKFKEYCRKK